MITCVQLIHWDDVIMGAMVSQITSLTIVYSSRWFRRRSKKISKLRVTGLCEGNSPVTGECGRKGPLTRKMLPFDDVIMHSATLLALSNWHNCALFRAHSRTLHFAGISRIWRKIRLVVTRSLFFLWVLQKGATRARMLYDEKNVCDQNHLNYRIEQYVGNQFYRFPFIFFELPVSLPIFSWWLKANYDRI